MSIKTYALSVAVIVVITEISDLLLPSGKMKNATKTVFSILTILVFATPVITFYKSDFNIGKIFDTAEVRIDESFVEYSSMVRNELLSDKALDALEREGIADAQVAVETEIFQGAVTVKKITINFGDLVINENEWHIYKTRARTIVATALDVDEKVVAVIE